MDKKIYGWKLVGWEFHPVFDRGWYEPYDEVKKKVDEIIKKEGDG